MSCWKPELLAPAGSLESLKAAVNAGADAVYVGGTKFGARAYADNPAEEALLSGISYAHLYGAHVHLTVNTLMKEEELSALPEFIRPYCEAGLDAAIVQDIGAFPVLRRYFPLLSLHASTQCTVTGPESAAFFKSLGAVRVIPARELSLKELIRIREKTGLEVETFIHGALCYAYSGQCLMSSLIGGRSGNRGRCAQTCRLPFSVSDGAGRQSRPSEPCLLSCKDLCGLDLIPDLVSAGIASLKIEGRMKSPRYTAGVVEIYRKYLDLFYREGREGFHVEPEDRRQLLELFDRGGQTDGYFYRHNGRDMLTLKKKPEFRESNTALFNRLEEQYVRQEKKIPVTGEAVIKAGEPMRLTAGLGEGEDAVRVEVTGAVPEKAASRSASEEETLTRLRKTGDTPFVFENLELTLEPGLFLPVSALNTLRRSALSVLREKILKRAEDRGAKREMPADAAAVPVTQTSADSAEAPCILHVTAETEEQLSAAMEEPSVGDVSLSADCISPERWKKTGEILHRKGKRALLCMPQIFREEALQYFDRWNRELVSAGFDAFVIRSPEEAGELRRRFREAGGGTPVLCPDFTVYAFNREAAARIRDAAPGRRTLSVELNRRELRGLAGPGTELVVAGRLPMMVSAQCLKKTAFRCDRQPALLTLKDRNGAEMPVRTHCAFCFNEILNADPLWLGGEAEDVRGLGVSSVRVLLTDESGEESRRVIRAAADAFLSGKRVSDPYGRSTRGHFKRGVE